MDITSESLMRPRADRVFQVDKLRVEIYSSRLLLGLAAASDVGASMKDLLSTKAHVSMVFAAAPSQNEFLAALAAQQGIDWSHVVAFHMDEYIGLPATAVQRFGYFLAERLFDRVKPGVVHYLDGNASDLEKECQRYAQLLRQNPPDIVCLGIGENGHIAFNDPGVADFADPELVKVVELDERCRLQQVHDGCFPDIESVPKRAITMTIPALMSGKFLHCVVPGRMKAEAVKSTLHGPITPDCPASILRRHDHAILYLDVDSASLL